MEHQKYEIIKKTSSNDDVIQFSYTSTPYMFINDNELKYTIATSDDYSHNIYNYYCLKFDCKYICEVVNDVKNAKNWMLSIIEKCYEVSSRVVAVDLFNKAYEDVVTDVKTIVNNNNNAVRRRNSVLKEDDYDDNNNNKIIKENGNNNGYYYEDIKQTTGPKNLGYYKGYFLLNNKLTIIEHTSGRRQEKIAEIKLVKELNSETNSFVINDIDDFDDELSGIEFPSLPDDIENANCTRGFIKFDKISECGSERDKDVENYLKHYIGYMYNVSDDRTSLVITNINDDNDKLNISLKEIDENKMNNILSKITKNVIRINDRNKCINVKVNETNTMGYDYKHKNEWISNGIIIDDQKYYKEMNFKVEKLDCLSCGIDYFESGSRKYYYQYSTNDVKYYKSDNNPFYHSFDGLESEDFVDCSDDYLTYGMKYFDDNIESIRKLLPTNSTNSGNEEDGKQDNQSDRYSVVFSLISILLLTLL